MSKLIDTFVPPGVQRRLQEQLGQTPRVMPRTAHDKIRALWQRRNKCDESEIEEIDNQMLAIAIEATKTPGVLDQSRAINTRKNCIQSSIDRRDGGIHQ